MATPRPNSYALPANDIPQEVHDSLNPWIAGFIGLTPQEATDRLHNRWELIESKSLCELRDVLKKFEVRAIVDYGEGGRIHAVRPGVENEKIIGNSFYLPGPISDELLASHLAACDLAEVEEFPEFLKYFGGLAEDTTTAGHFIHTEEWTEDWTKFTDATNELHTEYSDDGIEGFDDWRGSVIIFQARNGCCLLLRSDGHVAWWVFQEMRVEEIAPTFGEFINQFSMHRKLAWPFNPYEPPIEVQRGEGRGKFRG